MTKITEDNLSDKGDDGMRAIMMAVKRRAGKARDWAANDVQTALDRKFVLGDADVTEAFSRIGRHSLQGAAIYGAWVGLPFLAGAFPAAVFVLAMTRLPRTGFMLKRMAENYQRICNGEAPISKDEFLKNNQSARAIYKLDDIVWAIPTLAFNYLQTGFFPWEEEQKKALAWRTITPSMKKGLTHFAGVATLILATGPAHALARGLRVFNSGLRYAKNFSRMHFGDIGIRKEPKAKWFPWRLKYKEAKPILHAERMATEKDYRGIYEADAMYEQAFRNNIEVIKTGKLWARAPEKSQDGLFSWVKRWRGNRRPSQQ